MSSFLRKLLPCSNPPSESQGNDVECAVCQDQPKIPCTVPCGNNHIFCLACLQGLVAHNHHRNSFPCPLCRKRVRIPVGGVAVFKNGRGPASKILSRLPVIRPRCRSSSTDSGDSYSLSMFDLPSLDLESSDSDVAVGDIESTTSEESGSARAPDLSGIIPAEILDVETQAAILEEIQIRCEQERELDLVTSPNLVRNEPEDHDVRITVSGARSSEAECEPVFEASGCSLTPEETENGLSLAVLPNPDSEELDMAVVMQLIADLEDISQQEDDIEDRGSDTIPSAMEEADSDLDQDEDLGIHRTVINESDRYEDWKSVVTAADTLIPRPTFLMEERSGAERWPEVWEDHAAVTQEACPEPLQRMASKDSSPIPDDTDTTDQWEDSALPQPQRATLNLTDTSSLTDKQQFAQSSANGITETSKQQIHLKNKLETEHGMLATEQEMDTIPVSTEHSEELHDDESVFYSSENGRKNDQQLREISSNSNQNLSPEEWRLQELHKLKMAELRRKENLRVEDSDVDVEGIVSEEPEAWTRRICSLHNRRRGHSSSGQPRCDDSENVKRKAMDIADTGDNQTECRGLHLKGVPVNVLKDSTVKKGNNVTVINV